MSINPVSLPSDLGLDLYSRVWAETADGFSGLATVIRVSDEAVTLVPDVGPSHISVTPGSLKHYVSITVLPPAAE